MIKPIAPGCKAITYNCALSSNNNKIVTALNYIGPIDGFYGSDYWETDGVFTSLYGGKYRWVREINLMRIDNPDLQKQIENEKEIENV